MPPVAQQLFDQIHHEQRQIGRIRKACRMGGHEVFQAPILFRVAEIELQLESKAVIVNQIVKPQCQITTEQQHVRLGECFQIGLDNANDIQRLRKGLVARLELIRATLDALLYVRVAQIPVGNCAWIEFVAVDTLGATPGIWAVTLCANISLDRSLSRNALQMGGRKSL